MRVFNEDKLFFAKVGNRYLNGHSLAKRGEAFECKEEPIQRINQLKKDGKIRKDAKVKITSINESKFDNLYKQKVNGMVSAKDKWNLKMDIESFKKELVDLQNTASKLPDAYVKEVCDFDSYPFDSEIDNDLDLNSWCTDVDDFLSDSLSLQDTSFVKGYDAFVEGKSIHECPLSRNLTESKKWKHGWLLAKKDKSNLR